MNLEKFNPDEFINQFNVKLESEGATPEESRAFKLGVACAISSIDAQIEKGATPKELSTVCKLFGSALEGGYGD